MRVPLLVLLAASAFAQPAPEIRGIVIERGPNTPLAGAEVTLYEFVPNGDTLDARVFKTLSTDPRGAFSFKPGHLGDFRLEVKKPGYITPDEGPRNPGGETLKLQLFLDERNATSNHRIVLMNPSSLSGRVVDEDRKPVANFRVLIQPVDSLLLYGRGTPAVTDADGNFTAAKLPPGPYVVRTAVENMQGLSITDYSEAEANIVDEAYETAYWPGGVADPKAALPLPVPPGTPANIGTIVLRKTRYHRAAVELAGDCTSEEWTYSLIKLPRDPRIVEQRSITGPCRKQFLVGNLPPGSYTLAVSVSKNESLRWALVPITITRENIATRFLLNPVTDVTIRFLTSNGTPLPPLRVPLAFRSVDGAVGIGVGMLLADTAETVTVRNVPWARYSVSIADVPKTHAVREVRYNYQPAHDGEFTLVPGALLEIILDNRPSSISGTVKGGTNAAVVLHRWPSSRPGLEGNEPFSYLAQVRPDGTFQISGLAPGEYRLRAATLPLLDDAPTEGEKIVLGEGESKTVELKLP
jgi:hypothetical protein